MRVITRSHWERIPYDQKYTYRTERFVLRRDPFGVVPIPVTVLSEDRVAPMPGDMVRLTGQYPGVKAGEFAILDGIVGQREDEYLAIFHASAFRGTNTGGEANSLHAEYVSCSGGPGLYLRADELEYTEELGRAHFWRWRDLPKAQGGFEYTLDVPVWNWHGR